jgi:hypothetical protein
MNVCAQCLLLLVLLPPPVLVRGAAEASEGERTLHFTVTYTHFSPVSI